MTAGFAHARARRFREASEAFGQACRLDPRVTQAWCALGDARHAAGDAAGGDAAHMRAVQASANDPQLAQAAKALAEGRADAAYPILTARLKAEPSNAAALRMMAAIGRRVGRLHEALGMLARAIELAPGFEAAWRDLAEALHMASPAEALAEVDRQLARQPDSLGYRNLRAAMLERNGRFEAALAAFQAILAERPDEAGAWLAAGHLQKTLGRVSEAVAAYRQAAQLRPGSGQPWWALADMKSFRFEAADVAAMTAGLARRDVSPDDRILLEFALGRALETAGDAARSFAHYAEGNRLRRAQVRHDPDELDRERQAAERMFTPALFVERAGAGHPASDPIFIVGLPRSGSTLVEQILASHPQVEGTMELQELPGVVRDMAAAGRARGAAYPDALGRFSNAELAGFGKAYLDRVQPLRRAGRPHFIDKLPANFRHIGAIRLILPNARVIDVRRDPLACGLSIFKQHFASGHSFGFSLEDIGAYYRGYVATMDLWDRVAPGHVRRIVYEDLVADTEGQVRRLLTDLGLPFDPACLRFHETVRAVRTPSGDQVRRPIYSEGVDQWRRYEPWLGPLKAALGPA